MLTCWIGFSYTQTLPSCLNLWGSQSARRREEGEGREGGRKGEWREGGREGRVQEIEGGKGRRDIYKRGMKRRKEERGGKKKDEEGNQRRERGGRVRKEGDGDWRGRRKGDKVTGIQYLQN